MKNEKTDSMKRSREEGGLEGGRTLSDIRRHRGLSPTGTINSSERNEGGRGEFVLGSWQRELLDGPFDLTRDIAWDVQSK